MEKMCDGNFEIPNTPKNAFFFPRNENIFEILKLIILGVYEIVSLSMANFIITCNLEIHVSEISWIDRSFDILREILKISRFWVTQSAKDGSIM